MGSAFATVCDAVVTLLQAQVAGLSSATVHRYSPWAPEELQPDGKRHLAVWPMAGTNVSENPVAVATGSQEFDQLYAVTVWEASSSEAERQASDETGDRAFFDLHDAILDVFYTGANQQIGGSYLSWYAGTELPEKPSTNRWFRIQLQCRRLQPFS